MAGPAHKGAIAIVTAVFLSALAAIAALLYGAGVFRTGSWGSAVAKTVSVVLLALVAGLSGAPWLLVAGLVLSSFGDFFLARPGDRAFLFGMGAFFAAHLAYVGLFSWLATRGGNPPLSPLLSGAVLAYAAGVYALVYPGLGAFRVPVAAYSVAIAAMGWAALGVPFAGAGGLVPAGALLFVFSDTILAVEKFRLPAAAPARRFTAPLVWGSYWLAQSTIVLGVLGATTGRGLLPG